MICHKNKSNQTKNMQLLFLKIFGLLMSSFSLFLVFDVELSCPHIKHLKKAERYIGWNAVIMKIKMRSAVQLVLPCSLGLKNTPTASLQRVKTPPPNKCPGYDTKRSDGEALVMLELCRMWITSSLPLLPGPLWPEVVAPNRALSIG